MLENEVVSEEVVSEVDVNAEQDEVDNQDHQPAEETVNVVEIFKEDEISIDQVSKARTAIGSLEKERKRFEKYINKLPEEPEGAEKKDNLVKGIGLCILGQAEKATPYLECVKSDPLACYYLAKAFHLQGDLKMAGKTVESYIKKKSDDFHGYALKLEILGEGEKWDDVLSSLKSFKSKHAKNPDYQYHYGFYFDNQGEKEKAIEYYTKALELEEDHVPSLHRLAVLKDQAGDDEEAMEIYGRLRTMRPTPVNSLINLGLLYEDHSRFDEAVKCYQEVLEEYPNHERARLYLKDSESSTSMYYDEEKERKEDRRNQILRIPITDFELSVRSRNCLAKMNINTLGDLIKLTEAELLSYKNFGETSLTEIKSILASKNLRLGQGREEKEEEKEKESVNIDEIFTQTEGDEEASIMDKPISELDLSVRSRKGMVQLNIYTLGDLVKRSEADLMACKNFGMTSLEEIQRKLGEQGLHLKEVIH